MSLENDVKSWLQSKTIWGALISGASTIAGAYFRLEFPADFTTQLSIDLATFFGIALTIYGRVRAVKKIK